MTPLRQQLIDLLNAIDSTPGRRRLLICGRSVYERITDDDIEWLRREHNCEVVPPMAPQTPQRHHFPPFCHAVSPGHLWFRVFGWGLCVKDARRYPLLFSERMKLTGRSIGWLHVSILRPRP